MAPGLYVRQCRSGEGCCTCCFTQLSDAAAAGRCTAHTSWGPLSPRLNGYKLKLCIVSHKCILCRFEVLLLLHSCKFCLSATIVCYRVG